MWLYDNLCGLLVSYKSMWLYTSVRNFLFATQPVADELLAAGTWTQSWTVLLKHRLIQSKATSLSELFCLASFQNTYQADYSEQIIVDLL